MKRRPMKKSSARRLFKKTANRTHPKNNIKRAVMRGGVRL